MEIIDFYSKEGAERPAPFNYQIKTAGLLTATLSDAVLSTETGFCRYNVSTRATFVK